jgi:hypothetical protein
LCGHISADLLPWYADTLLLKHILTSLPNINRLPVIGLLYDDDEIFRILCDHGKALSKIRLHGLPLEVPHYFGREYWSKCQLSNFSWIHFDGQSFDSDRIFQEHLSLGMSADLLTISTGPASMAHGLSIAPFLRGLLERASRLECIFNANSLETSENFILEALQIINTRVSSLSKIILSISTFNSHPYPYLPLGYSGSLIRHDYFYDSLQKCITRLPEPLSPIKRLFLHRTHEGHRAFYFRELAVTRMQGWAVTRLHIEIVNFGIGSQQLWTLIEEACPSLTSLQASLTRPVELDVDAIAATLVCMLCCHRGTGVTLLLISSGEQISLHTIFRSNCFDVGLYGFHTSLEMRSAWRELLKKAVAQCGNQMHTIRTLVLRVDGQMQMWVLYIEDGSIYLKSVQVS